MGEQIPVPAPPKERSECAYVSFDVTTPSCIQLCWCTHSGWEEAPRGRASPLACRAWGQAPVWAAQGPSLPLSLPQDRKGGCCAPKELIALRSEPSNPHTRPLQGVLCNTEWFLSPFHARLRGCRSFPSAASPADPRRRGCRAVGRGDTAPCH